MTIKIHCRCGRGGRMTDGDARAALMKLGKLAYHKHVRDPRAFAMRLAKLTGWRWDGRWCPNLKLRRRRRIASR
jgi:hypothetical protein